MMKEICDCASELARAAGKILMTGFRSAGTVVSYKSRTDLVTNVDRESEAYLFGEGRKRYPDHTVIAEEGSRSDSGGGFTWYIDPLDATNTTPTVFPSSASPSASFPATRGK